MRLLDWSDGVRSQAASPHTAVPPAGLSVLSPLPWRPAVLGGARDGGGQAKGSKPQLPVSQDTTLSQETCGLVTLPGKAETAAEGEPPCGPA